jgi:hypothetical protein
MKAVLNFPPHNFGVTAQVTLDQPTTGNIIPFLTELPDLRLCEKPATNHLATIVSNEICRTATWETLTYLSLELAAAALIIISLVQAIR